MWPEHRSRSPRSCLSNPPEESHASPKHGGRAAWMLPEPWCSRSRSTGSAFVPYFLLLLCLLLGLAALMLAFAPLCQLRNLEKRRSESSATRTEVSWVEYVGNDRTPTPSTNKPPIPPARPRSAQDGARVVRDPSSSIPLNLYPNLPVDSPSSITDFGGARSTTERPSARASFDGEDSALQPCRPTKIRMSWILDLPNGTSSEKCTDSTSSKRTTGSKSSQ